MCDFCQMGAVTGFVRCWETRDPLAGIRVSNGRNIVYTDENGKFTLPVKHGETVFVIKPRDWSVVQNENGVPEFFHRVSDDFAEMEFLLEPTPEPDDFRMVILTDPHLTGRDEDLSNLDRSLLSELRLLDFQWASVLGDIATNRPDLLKEFKAVMGILRRPWYPVVGNHDRNYEGVHDDTWTRIMSPEYYSFDYGPVHVLVLDDYPNYDPDPLRIDYAFGPDQMRYIEQDLKLIPPSKPVLLLMHISLNQVKECREVCQLLEGRPVVFSVSGHAHNQSCFRLTPEQGWNSEFPHWHIILSAACGAWWMGARDEFGIPHALQGDGTPKGYLVIEFNKGQFHPRFKVSGRQDDFQMSLYAPSFVSASFLEPVPFMVNAYLASREDTMEGRLDDGTWVPLVWEKGPDGFQVETLAREQAINSPLVQPISATQDCDHRWVGTLPRDLSPGFHLLEIRHRTPWGDEHQASQIIKVTE